MSDEENWDDGDDGDGNWDDDVGDEDEEWPDQSDEEDQDQTASKITIENLFWEAEDNRRHNPRQALTGFEQCVELEKKEGDEIFKRFKALECIVTLHFQFHEMDKMIDRYKELLSYANRVTRNESAESINNVINAVSDSNDFENLKEIYQVTLDTLNAIPGQERMWFTISMKLCKTHMDKKQYDDVRRLLREMHRACTLDNGSDDPTKGSQLLEIYAVEIQLMSEVGDTVRLKELFAKTKILTGEINDPRSMSVIRECWGKMFASIDRWRDAYAEFFAAFLQYQEIGHYKAKQCLKYVVVANMLSQTDANPFDAREAKVYEHDPEIEAVVNLRQAYDNDDIRLFEDILRKQQATITNDPFIKSHVDALLLRIRSRACVNLIRPYKRIYISYLSKRLNISDDEVETLIVNLILDDVIVGKVDQINGLLDLSSRSTESVTKKYNAIDEWSGNLGSLADAVMSRAASDPYLRRPKGGNIGQMHLERHNDFSSLTDWGVGLASGLRGAFGFGS